MYRVILDERSLTGVSIDADELKYTPDSTLELFKDKKRVAIFRSYVGVIPTEEGK